MPEWRLLMRRLVTLAGMVPVAGCGSVVVGVPGDASVDVAQPDVTHPDVSRPDVVTDVGPDAACAPTYESGPTCERVVHFPCGVPAELRADGGVPSDLCSRTCGASDMPPIGTAFSCYVAIPDDAPPTDLHCIYCAVGRRPEGLSLTSSSGPHAVGRFLADIAALEAASVPALERLADDLARHDAHRDLVARCRTAADDERRHTVMMGALARRYGCEPSTADVPPAPARSLEDLARENAVEGCVRETFGALIASWQSGHAGDLLIARTMAVVAEEETRHAALSWDLAAWFDTVLPPDAQARVRAARDGAMDVLRGEVCARVDDDLVRLAGMPDPERALAMFDGLCESLAD